MSEGKPDLKIVHSTGGSSDVIPVAKDPKEVLNDAARRFFNAERRKASPSATRVLAERAGEKAAHFSKELGDYATRVRSRIEMSLRVTKRRELVTETFEKFLGEYDQEAGKFKTGGLEAIAGELVGENEAVLGLVEQADQTGYKEFGRVMHNLQRLKPEIEKADDSFRTLNNEEDQGSSWINLKKLKTREQRAGWMAKTFGMKKERVIELWDRAHQVKHEPLADEAERDKNWHRLMVDWNNRGVVTKEEQVAILGLMELTEANGISNFLQAGVVRNSNNQDIEAVSLTGNKLKTAENQYFEIVSAFVDSISRNGEHLKYDSKRGVLISVHYAHRAMIRDALDFITPDDAARVAENAPADARIKGTDLLEFLFNRENPDVKGTENRYRILNARAMLEEAYFERFRGTVNTAERFNQSRFEKAAFDEVASAQIIHDEWFGRIPGLKEAVAKYTNGSNVFDAQMEEAKNAKDVSRIKELENAERYAGYVLEMWGMPAGGLYKEAHHTFVQVFDTTRSARSGPLSERVGTNVSCPIKRETISSAIQSGNFDWHARVEPGASSQVLVVRLNGLSGEIILDDVTPVLMATINTGGDSLTNYLINHGVYRENGYWSDWGEVVGVGFNPYAKDGIEHSFGLLSENNLAMYQNREAWREVNEAYNGSEEHKRIFIKFLLGKRQALGGQGWRNSFQEENGIPFDPYNNDHIMIVARKLGIAKANIQETIESLADPNEWSLYFDPTNTHHVDRILGDIKNLGMDRFFLNILWAFDAITELRESTNTLVEMGIHGVHFENGIWTGLTVEGLEKQVGKWKHIGDPPTAALEVLAKLEDTLNRAQTEELVRAIRSRDNSVSHKTLGNLFRHDLWRVAQLTSEEKATVLREGRILGEAIPPLSDAERARGQTILGRAMEMKGYRMQLNLRATMDQMLFTDLVIQPGVSLSAIYEKLISQNMFEFCLPLLTAGDVERITQNPILYSYLPLDDSGSYRLVDNRDPRHGRMRDYVLGALYVTSSMAVEDQLALMGINARKIAWNEHSAAGNQGLWLSRVKALWGINNVMPVNDQLTGIYESLQNINWTELDGEYAYLPDVVIRFAREFYDIDITSKEEVERLGGGQFLEQFQKIISDRQRLMFVMFGVKMTQPHLLPAKYENFYKVSIGNARRQTRDGNEWFEDLSPLTIKRRDQTEETVTVTFETAIDHIKSKWLREPVYGPWPDLPMPHIGVDNQAAEAASFLSPDRNIGQQIVEVVDLMQELASTISGAEVTHTVRTRFFPQLERYALNFMRTIEVDGNTIMLSPLNIRKYMPAVVEDFRNRLSSSSGTYDLNFMRNYFVCMYGLDMGSENHTLSIKGFRNEVMTLYGETNFRGYVEHLGRQIENLRNLGDRRLSFLDQAQRIGAAVYLYQIRDLVQWGVEGPSTLYKLIKIAQDRNYGYYFQRIFEKRVRYLGMSDEEKFQYFEKLQELADFEIVELNEPKGRVYLTEAYNVLKDLGFENETELGIFIGAVKGYGLEELHTVLFSINPAELEPLFEKGLISMTDAKGKMLSAFEAAKTIGQEKENQFWHATAYQPLVGLDLPFSIGAALGLKMLEPIARFLQKTPFTPKVGSLIYVLPFIGIPSTILGAVSAAVSSGSLTTGSFTILQALSEIPFHLFSYEALGSLGAAYILSGIIHGGIIVPIQYWQRRNSGKYAATITEYFGKIFSKQGAYF